MTVSFLPRATFLLLLVATASLHAENWPQWRGPNNDGISNEKNLPTVWNESKNIAWKLKMPGMSGATPIIYGGSLKTSCKSQLVTSHE